MADDNIFVLGVGNTDYPADARETRQGARLNPYALAARALKRALADAAMAKAEIDGIVVGGQLVYERFAEIVGNLTHYGGVGDCSTVIEQAQMAVLTGKCKNVAVVFALCPRSSRMRFGGRSAAGGDRQLPYTYHNRVGLTSQGALYAMVARRHMAVYGTTEEDWGVFSCGVHNNATPNVQAHERDPLTVDDYMALRYIAEPLRRPDYCLMNDGAVSMIFSGIPRGPHPVRLGYVGRQDDLKDATQLRSRMDFYHENLAAVAESFREANGFGVGDVDFLEVYDSFSVHIPLALEGLGIVGYGEAASYVRDKGISATSEFPVNPSGGHLAEAYMQGWNHQVDAVRQVRGDATGAQVPGAQRGVYLSSAVGRTSLHLYERV
ncbi:MAG: thiolase family protein [Streptosporangiales bacterium]|nr:thiolase family protein [Streptosporangiales bacterium]